ncbi:hypothetical protein P167DRAFT_153238 [Morchella conica CCBAS932]|uniref:Uncharacterized protein n=1 Tax=Morchella conica CCBAS932 TaxID=1392247 RepID=A0A3N4KQJ4_9PEZI|nr:hypothetical protein P167DRAFT_153238 [Morchella conica CCBAS932]
MSVQLIIFNNHERTQIRSLLVHVPGETVYINLMFLDDALTSRLTTYSHSRGEGGSCLMAVRDLRPVKELGFGRQGQITANRTIRQDSLSVGLFLPLLRVASIIILMQLFGTLIRARDRASN